MTVIVVEGDGDKAFLEYLLDEKLKLHEYEIINNGSHGFTKDNLIQLKKHSDNGHNIIIINDVDNNLASRIKEIQGKLDSKQLKGEIFLLPNNQDIGVLEDLLLSCVPENKKFISECFEKYQECIKNNNNKEYINIPAIKGRVYDYVDIQLNDSERKSRKKKFHDYAFHRTDIWDYDSTAVQPLLEFLRTHVK